jgi:hypothetical protein
VLSALWRLLGGWNRGICDGGGGSADVAAASPSAGLLAVIEVVILLVLLLRLVLFEVAAIKVVLGRIIRWDGPGRPSSSSLFVLSLLLSVPLMTVLLSQPFTTRKSSQKGKEGHRSVCMYDLGCEAVHQIHKRNNST